MALSQHCPLILLHAKRVSATARGGGEAADEPQASRGVFDVVPAATPDPESGVVDCEYSLIAGRRYRLAAREEADAATWAGVRIRMRLVYADDGSDVPSLDGKAGPLLEFPLRTARYGLPVPSLVISLNESGISDGTFGIGVTCYRHKRLFRLVLEKDDMGESLGGMTVRTVAHLSALKPRSGKKLEEEEETGSEEVASQGPPPASKRRKKDGEKGAPPERSFPLPTVMSDAAPGPVPFFMGMAPPPGPFPFGPWAGPGLPFPPVAPLAAPTPPPAPPPAPSSAPSPSPRTRPKARLARCGPLARPSDGGGGPEAELGDAFQALAQLQEFEGYSSVRSFPAVPDAAPAEGLTAAVPALPAAPAGLEPPLPPLFLRLQQRPPPPSAAESAPQTGANGGKLEPPYRHASERGRHAALQAVADADADLQHAAAAASARHPVPAGATPAPPSSPPAAPSPPCAVSSPGVFDTPLFRSRDGRFGARLLLEDTRLSGSAALATGVFDAWRELLAAAAPTTAAPGRTPSCWRSTAGIASRSPRGRPPPSARAPAASPSALTRVPAGLPLPSDLLPVDRGYVFSLLDKADEALAPHVAEPGGKGAALRARALLHRGRAADQFGELQASMDMLFEAWSLLLRTGHSPSRLEAHVLRHLASVLLRTPHKFELASREICAKLYWFTGDDEDRYDEACALETLAAESMARGNWKAAKVHLKRADDLLERMSVGFRVHAERLQQAMLRCSLQTADAPGCIRHAGLAFGAAEKLLGFSFPELDIVLHTHEQTRRLAESRWNPAGYSGPRSMEQLTAAMRWIAPAMAAGRLRDAFQGHLEYVLALSLFYARSYRDALASFEKVKHGLFDKYPAYFPSHLRRVQLLNAAVEDCRRALSADIHAPAPGPAAPPSPGRVPIPGAGTTVTPPTGDSDTVSPPTGPGAPGESSRGEAEGSEGEGEDWSQSARAPRRPVPSWVR
eukprot:tig00021319_g20209.t1